MDDNELVQPGQTILTIGDRSSGLIVTLALSDRDVVRVSQGDTATVSFAALSTPVAGKVARIAGKADPRTGAFDVEVAIDGAPQGLLSGMIGEASIAPSRTEPVARWRCPANPLSKARASRGASFWSMRRAALRAAARSSLRNRGRHGAGADRPDARR